MAKVVTDDLVIRAYWPVRQRGEGRTSYSILCFAAAFGFLAVAVVYALLGSPLVPLLGQRFDAINAFALALALVLVASVLSYWFDGTVLVANRERIVLNKWFRKPTVVVIRDLGRIVLCSVDNEFSYSPNRLPAIFFFNRDGRCVMSLYARFREEDLGQLWSLIGIKPEGSWTNYVSSFQLKQRFPGAF